MSISQPSDTLRVSNAAKSGVNRYNAEEVKCLLLQYRHPDVIVLDRSVVPRAVLAVHAAFHTLYTVLATFARRWCLQQNIQRLQVLLSSSVSDCKDSSSLPPIVLQLCS